MEIGAKNDSPAVELRGGDAVAKHATGMLTDYLDRVTGSAPAKPARHQIILGDASVAREFGLKAPDESSDESFVIAPLTREGRIFIVASATSDKGIKQAVYHLLRNLSLEGEKLLLSNASIDASPFIRLRVTHAGGAMHQAFDRETGKRLPKAIPPTTQQLQWNHIDQWDAKRVGEYADLMDFCGYNGFEEPPAFYQPDQTDAATIARRKTLREHLDMNGMIGVAKIDGTLSDEHGAVPYGADTRERYDAYYRAMAQTAAPYNEFVLTHWVDAGGWKSTQDHPCTIELLCDLHMQIDREFKRVNPRIRSILSLWNLKNPNYNRWLGYQPAGVETILNGGKIPADVGIAMSRIWHEDEAAKILAAKHPLAVWSWYMADNELIYTMHVHTHPLADFAKQLPPDAHDKLFMNVMDNCQRETNLYSEYVAARVMWDPKQDPDALLREIARIIYGPKLEQRVFDGLRAIADIRCGDKQCVGFWRPGGLRTLDEARKQSSDAWAQLKDAQIDPSYIPPIKFHEPPDMLLSELKGQVQAVATYMHFAKDRTTEVPAADGPFESYERIQYLQKR